MTTHPAKTPAQLLDELRAMQKRAERAEARCLALETELELNNQLLGEEKEQRESIARALSMAKLIVDRSPVILFRRKAGDEARLDYISENFRQFGYDPEEFFSSRKHFRDIIYEHDRDRVRNEIRGFAATDVEEYTQQYRIVTKSGEIRWVADQTSIVRDEAGKKIFNQGVLIDITDRMAAEEKLRKNEEKFRRIVETAAEGFYLTDKDLKITDVNDAYCRMVGYQRSELLGKKPFDLATKTTQAYLQVQKDILLSQEYREFEAELLARDGRIIPVLVHGNTLRDDNGAIIGNMAFVTDMTEHRKALVLAGKVQKSLLPHEKPQAAGLDVAGRNISCDEIGGDYFDFLWRQDSGKGSIGIVVGDISGHGVDSALLMTTARAFLRMRASQPGTISEIISDMNNHLAIDTLDSGRFMTLFYLTIDLEQCSLSWVRAGHDPALVYTPENGQFEELKGEGIALGITDSFIFSENHKKGLSRGQIIVIGTDGIWEASNSQGQMFGKQRMCDIIRNHAADSADDILNAVYGALSSFTSGTRPEDDITLVIIKVQGLP